MSAQEVKTVDDIKGLDYSTQLVGKAIEAAMVIVEKMLARGAITAEQRTEEMKFWTAFMLNNLQEEAQLDAGHQAPTIAQTAPASKDVSPYYNDDPRTPRTHIAIALESGRMQWQDLVNEDRITCPACGDRFKALSRHLRIGHAGLTPAQLRMTYNLPENFPMVAKNTSIQRSKINHDMHAERGHTIKGNVKAFGGASE